MNPAVGLIAWWSNKMRGSELQVDWLIDMKGREEFFRVESDAHWSARGVEFPNLLLGYENKACARELKD